MTKHSVAPRALPLYCALSLSLLTACAGEYGVVEIDDTTWFRRETRSALSSLRPSAKTLRFLRRNDLMDRVADEPLAVMADLHERLITEKERRLAFHLAELYFLTGRRSGSAIPDYFLASAEYAYAYLFDPSIGPAASPYHPTFRQACDFYNRSVARVIERTFDENMPRDAPTPLSSPVGPVVLTRGISNFDLAPRDVVGVLPTYDFEVHGLRSVAKSFGVGTPCIALRRPRPLQTVDPETRVGPPGVAQVFACTAIFQFEGEIVARGEQPRGVTIDVFDPLSVDEITIGKRRVPLEYDLTTPLAYLLEQSPPMPAMSGMLDVESYESQMGLVMFQEFDPDRIPVLFVHGLMSSPLTWAQIVNEMLADKELRDRYQFWFFRYPTGNPIVLSASVLRRSLTSAQRQYDPDDENPAFQNMLLCGHSMGGLLSRLQIFSSGDRLWQRITDTPLADLELDEEERAMIEESVYFDRLPFVKRVIFMCTPHRGASLATSFVGRLGASMIRLPRRITNTTNSMVSRLQGMGKTPLVNADDLTSIANLAPTAPLLVEIGSWVFPDDVALHSVIGNTAGPVPGGTDGVVAYESSHIDEAVSEVVVKADHSAHKHALAIKEVRRILHQHLREFDAAQAAAAKKTKSPVPVR